MKITKKFIKTLIIFYIFSTAISCGKEEPVQSTVNEFLFKIQFFVGDVKILRGDAEISVNQGDQLNIADTIITGSKSSIDILYGSSGIIRINENSNVSIASIADDKNSDTVMNMEKGKVFAAFTKLKGTKFNVKTPTVVASVRGTSFSLVSDKSGAKVAVLKGTVTAEPVKDGNIIEDKAVEVQANQKTDSINEASVDKIAAGKKTITVSKLTTAETTDLYSETKNLKDSIDAIPDMTAEEKEAMKKEMPYGTGEKTVVSPKKQNDTNIKAQSDSTLNDKKKAAEEVKKQAEQVKKERISNIPTM